MWISFPQDVVEIHSSLMKRLSATLQIHRNHISRITFYALPAVILLGLAVRLWGLTGLRRMVR